MFDGTQGRVRFTFPPTAVAVHTARRRLADTVHRWSAPRASGTRRLPPPDGAEADDTAASLELIASELFTNAVRHAGSQTPLVSVELVLESDALRLGVRDRGAALPTMAADLHDKAPPVPDDAVHGRGLAIVEAVLDSRGGCLQVIHHSDGSKTVWAHLPVPEAPALVAPPQTGEHRSCLRGIDGLRCGGYAKAVARTPNDAA